MSSPTSRSQLEDEIARLTKANSKLKLEIDAYQSQQSSSSYLSIPSLDNTNDSNSSKDSISIDLDVDVDDLLDEIDSEIATQEEEKKEKKEKRKKRKVWLDMDSMALYTKGKLQDGLADQDDGFACIAIMHCPDLFDIRGFSAVFGNGPIDETYQSLKDIIDTYYGENNKNRPGLYKGAAIDVMAKLHSNSNAQTKQVIDIENKAAIAMIKELESLNENEKLDILAIGPLTNIAEMILLLSQQKKTYLIEKIGSIHTCAGRQSLKQIFMAGTKQKGPFPDMNFDFDPMAFQILIQYELNIVFAGYEVSTHFWMKQEYLDELTQNGDNVISKLSSCYAVKNWIKHWKTWGNIWSPTKQEHDTGIKMPGFHPFDLLTAMYMIAPQCFTSYQCSPFVGINHINSPRFSNRAAFQSYLLCPKSDTTTNNVYVHHIKNKQNKFDKLVIEILKKTQKGTKFIDDILNTM